jgi:hypothetical protein
MELFFLRLPRRMDEQLSVLKRKYIAHVLTNLILTKSKGVK